MIESFPGDQKQIKSSDFAQLKLQSVERGLLEN
jgi:hypothetical protein